METRCAIGRQPAQVERPGLLGTSEERSSRSPGAARQQRRQRRLQPDRRPEPVDDGAGSGMGVGAAAAGHDQGGTTAQSRQDPRLQVAEIGLARLPEDARDVTAVLLDDAIVEVDEIAAEEETEGAA